MTDSHAILSRLMAQTSSLLHKLQAHAGHAAATAAAGTGPLGAGPRSAATAAAGTGPLGAGPRSAAVAPDVIDVEATVLPQAPQVADTTRTDGPAARLPSTFTHRSGRRPVITFLPSGAEPPRALLLMLHGCTQDGADFARGTRMDAWGEAGHFAVVYPTQDRRANPQGCWNWFKPAHQRRDHGECALLADLAIEQAAKLGVPRGRIYVAGLSAGGAMAALLAEHYPDVFAGAAIHSGLPAGAASSMPGALQAMREGRVAREVPRIPTLVLHGTDDQVVHPGNAGWPRGAGPGEWLARAPTGVRVRQLKDAEGCVRLEQWMLAGAPHAWSGGSAAGSWTHPFGADASAAVVRFFGLDGPAAAQADAAAQGPVTDAPPLPEAA